MRILFSKTLIFLILGAIILIPISYAIRNAKEYMVAKSAYLIPKETKILIVGDSHLETGINPKNITYSYSIAKSGENFFYTYYKLNYFIRQYPKIDTIIIGCSWHNFSKQYQESYLFGDKATTVNEYFPLLDNEAKTLLKRWSSIYIVPFLTYDAGMPICLYKNKFIIAGLLHKQIKSDEIPFLGGYKEITVSKIDDAGIKDKIKLYYGDTCSVKSDLMVRYLYKIIELCKDHNINILMVNSPVHPLFRAQLPYKYISSFNTVLSDILRKNHQLTYIDMSDLNLPDADYFDGDHVNKLGAEIVSNHLRDKIMLIRNRKSTNWTHHEN